MSSLVGQQLGKYQIKSLLGRGGMAEVYLAHDPQLDRDVAIKLMHPQLADEEGFAQRFSNEARAVARLRHTNIVQVHDFDLADGRPYMVMELMDGPTLKDRLKSLRDAGQQMPLPDALRVAAAIGSAIDYAHQKGMVHRDIKPSNILFTQAGEPVLADFGIAKIAGQTMHTAAGSVSGTPAYMAPEQAHGAADERSDLYSFAAVVYEMLTGRTPFSADTPAEMLLKHMQEPPPSPLNWRAALPPAVESILRKALAKNPDERYPSAAEFVAALQAAIKSEALPVAAQDALTMREQPITKGASPPPLKTESKAQAAQVGAPRAMLLLASAAALFAPLVGRDKVALSPDARTRRELATSLMAILGVILATLQFLANSLDLVSKTLVPLFNALPVLIVLLLALGAVGALSLMRRSSSAPHRQRAALVLGIAALGAVGWGGWLVYDKLRPPAGPIVMVADFQACKTCKEIEFGKRIYQRVKLETDRLKLPNLEVRHVLETYPDSATARGRGADYKATLVIWGSYDEAGILPHVELLRAPQTLPARFIQPEELSAADFHLQGGDKETAFVVLLALGLTRFAEADYATALSLYDAALQMLGDDTTKAVPNAEVAYYYQALAQYAGGEQWASIEDNLKKVVALKPNWADAHYLLALTYLSACKPDGSNALDLALSEAENAVRLRADGNNYYVRGLAQSQFRRWADAAKSYEQSLKLKDDSAVRSGLVEAYRKSGRNDLADQEAKRMAKLPPKSTDEIGALREQAEMLYYQGNLADAALRYQQAISRAVELKRSTTTLATLYKDLAETQAAQKQYDAALVNYRQAESLWGKNWLGYDSLAQVYQNLGKSEEAIAAYQKAIDNRPCNDGAHLSLAELYAKQGRNDLALDEYRKATMAEPTNGLAYLSMAQLLEAQGKSKEATTALQQALPLLEEQLRQEPVNANLAFVLGSTYFQLDQFASALAAFQKYVALAPADPDAHYWVGTSLHALGRFAEAVPELELADRQHPNSVLTLSELADAYKHVDRLADAAATYQKVVALDPKNSFSWRQLAQLAEQQQDWAEAAKAYEAVVGLTPNDAPAHTSLAFAYARLNRSADALKEFRAAATLQPSNAFYQVNLALALVSTNQNDEAISVARRALQLDSNQILAHYILGLAFKAKGDTAQAIGEFQIVVQSAKANAELKKAAEQELKAISGA